MKKLNTFFLIFLLYTVFFNSGRAQSAISYPEKTNFILIVADDLEFADLSLNGSKHISTPNINRLAQEGTNFTQGYVSAPVCAPSRAGLITGRNQVQFGFDNNLSENQSGFNPKFLGLPLSEKTNTDRLKPLGSASDRLPMLFNLTIDISEQYNVVLQNQERTKILLKQLGDWDVSLPHPVILKSAVWEKKQLDLYDKKFNLVQPE